MADAINHRGLDDGDVWIDPEQVLRSLIAACHLASRQRSPADAIGMFTLCRLYNGEIYNWAELRGELGQQAMH